MGPVSSKNSIRKRVFLDGRNFVPGHFCPQLFLLVCLAKKIGEVRFSTKIQTENVIFGETNSRGLLRQNCAKFSSGTILFPNAPYSQLGPEKKYGTPFVKEFHPNTLGEVRFCTKIQIENVFFGKMNSRGLLRQN